MDCRKSYAAKRHRFPRSSLKTKIATRPAKIGVIGLGYVGLPLALLFTEETFPVTGFDIDTRKVRTQGESGTYIFRIPAEQIQDALRQGFRATSEYARIADMDAVVICVPTPLNEHMEPDLSFITSTAQAIAPYLRAGQFVILLVIDTRKATRGIDSPKIVRC